MRAQPPKNEEQRDMDMDMGMPETEPSADLLEPQPTIALTEPDSDRSQEVPDKCSSDDAEDFCSPDNIEEDENDDEDVSADEVLEQLQHILPDQELPIDSKKINSIVFELMLSFVRMRADGTSELRLSKMLQSMKSAFQQRGSIGLEVAKNLPASYAQVQKIKFLLAKAKRIQVCSQECVAFVGRFRPV
jgi:hypothetical protein